MTDCLIIQKNPLRITEARQLEDINGLIHDESFELDDVRFQKDRKIVEIPYRRIFHDGPCRLVRNWLIFKTIEVDVIRSVLTICNVEKYTFKDSARIGTFSFNEVSFDGSALLFTCCEPLELKMVVSDLYVESKDIEIRGKARITQGLFWASYTGKVYE